ncbi:MULTISPECIES: nucleoside hydrolase [Acidiphilium]|uniref:Purine nucleosidase n=1 Tax=Acidiphilium rubrum TaxID=526 RepID=A0A8G2CMK0_ACIRU|nr:MULTISPECIES: nucleoside hydrolase [Acidiphilium]SIR25125.1 purine nucleosidase [Acidiphilium rubrum]
MRTLIIDTDTASDDAIALIMALRTPDVRIEAITIVSGNVDVGQGAINAGIVLDLCGARVPVYRGADRPLLKPRADAGYFHGADGLSDVGFPPPTHQAEPEPAVFELIRRCRTTPGTIDLVTLGPLTNIALALRIEPQLATWVRSCTIMGGNPGSIGNVTPAAEYNIWCDPEAAAIVLASGMPITLVGWDLSRGAACLDANDMARLTTSHHATARFAMACSRAALRAATATQAEPGLPLPDPVAMAVALDPSIVTHTTRCGVAIPLDGLARGATLIDELGTTGQHANDPAWAHTPPPIDVCRSIDIARFKSMLFRTLEQD